MAFHRICLVALLLLGIGADQAVKLPEAATQAAVASALLQPKEAGEEAETAVKLPEAAAQAGVAPALLQPEEAGEEAETINAEGSSQAEEDDEEDDDDDEGEDEDADEDGEDASLLQGAADAAGEDAEEEVAEQEGEADEEDADDEDDEEEDDEEEDDEEGADDAEPTLEAVMAKLDENKDGKLSLEELTKGRSDEAETTYAREAIKKVDSDADNLINMEELPKLKALWRADNEDDDDDDDEEDNEGEDASLLQGDSDVGGEDAEEAISAQEDEAEGDDNDEDEDDEEDDDEDAEAEGAPEALMAQHAANKDGKPSLEDLAQRESDEFYHTKDALKKVGADADGLSKPASVP